MCGLFLFCFQPVLLQGSPSLKDVIDHFQKYLNTILVVVFLTNEIYIGLHPQRGGFPFLLPKMPRERRPKQAAVIQVLIQF